MLRSLATRNTVRVKIVAIHSVTDVEQHVHRPPQPVTVAALPVRGRLQRLPSMSTRAADSRSARLLTYPYRPRTQAESVTGLPQNSRETVRCSGDGGP